MSLKQNRIIKIVMEFVKAGTSYDITGIDLGLAKFFYREPQMLFQDLAAGDYTISTGGGKQTLTITNPELLAKVEAFQVAYVLDFDASKYDTQWNVDINTLKDKYNQLLDVTFNVWEYVRKIGFVADDTAMQIILPQLNTGEVWVKTDTGWRGLNVGDIESNIKAFWIEFNKKTQEILEQIVAAGKVQEGLLEDFTQQKIKEINEEGLKLEVTQVGHGFIFNAVQFDKTTGTYTKADINTGADGIAVRIDDDRFYLSSNGIIEIPANAVDSKGNPYELDEYYFLDNDISGGCTPKKPTHIFQALFCVVNKKGVKSALVEIGDPIDLNPRILVDEINSLGLATTDQVVLSEPTIADLIASKKYKVGDVVQVLGYYSAGDGAGHKRQKKPVGYNGADAVIGTDGSIWGIVLNDNEIHTSWFGVKADGTTDNYETLQKVLDFAQKPSPTVVYDIVIDSGLFNIVCSKGLDISCNGYSGTIKMNGSMQYGTRISFENTVQQENAIFLKREFRDGKYYDRFGNEFFAYGSFTLENLRIQTKRIVKPTGVDYPLESDFINGIDVARATYSTIKDCRIVGFKGVGLNVGSWDSLAYNNKIEVCGIGIGVSIKNTININEDLATNNLILYKNSVNTCRNHIVVEDGTFVKIKDNTLDISSGASIIAKVVDVKIEDNYIEASNKDDVFDTIRFQDTYDNTFKEQQVKAKIIAYRPSNYQDFTKLTIRDNQIPNNTNFKEHSILAISGISSLDYDNNSKRGYEVNDIQLFGIGKNLNNYATIGGKYKINIASPVKNTAINYNLISQSYRKSIGNAFIFSERIINRNICSTPFIINNNFYFDSKMNVPQTQDCGNKIFGISGNTVANFDFSTSKFNKPSSIKVYCDIIKPNSQYSGRLNVKIYKDSVLKFEEAVSVSNTNGNVESFIPTVWLGEDYNTLKIELVAVGLGSVLISNFCICSAESGTVFETTEKQSVIMLDTPYHASNMQKLGILDSYHQYLADLHEYEKSQNVQSDSEIMTLNVLQPPTIPIEVEEYAKEYNLI